MNKVVQIISAIIAGIMGLIFGEMNKLFFALLAMIAIDYTTGVMVAITKKRLSSAVGFKGIAKKIVILAFVAVGHIVGYYVFDSGEACRDMVIGFYIANEGISILENGAKLGLPLPQKLRAALEQLKGKKNDKKQEE